MSEQEHWFTRHVADHIGVQPATITGYKARKQMPPPDGYVEEKPWWKPETIYSWQATRPGSSHRKVVA